MLYHVGDFVLCRTSKDNTIIFDVDFYDKRYAQFPSNAFEVIGIYDEKYYILLAPEYQHATQTLDEDFAQQYNIDRKFLHATIVLIREFAVGGRKYIDPYKHSLACKICKEYFPYAVANQADGKLICWVCRTTRRI